MKWTLVVGGRCGWNGSNALERWHMQSNISGGVEVWARSTESLKNLVAPRFVVHAAFHAIYLHSGTGVASYSGRPLYRLYLHGQTPAEETDNYTGVLTILKYWFLRFEQYWRLFAIQCRVREISKHFMWFQGTINLFPNLYKVKTQNWVQQVS